MNTSQEQDSRSIFSVDDSILNCTEFKDIPLLDREMVDRPPRPLLVMLTRRKWRICLCLCFGYGLSFYLEVVPEDVESGTE
jgi:hypothetical protein